jgi:hypothetical protein
MACQLDMLKMLHDLLLPDTDPLRDLPGAQALLG